MRGTRDREGAKLVRNAALLAFALVTACGGSNPPQVTVPSGVYDLEAPMEANRRGELVPGDALRVTVFREPDLTGEYPVDQNGVVVFPLLGERRVLGMAADSLEQVLVQAYREFLRDPAINVTVLRRVSVLGEVREPGLYPVDLTMSLNEALALAGGVSPNGNLNDIRLIRGPDVMLRDMEGGVPLSATPLMSGDQIFVGQRSWLSRNMALVTALITVSASLTIALLVR
jgi:polysaccharide export outer membrane protein